jgi:CheY-like chemotaxis protein
MKILIIDDQELVLMSLEKCLIDLGYEVITSNNVKDGIEKYDANLPNLVITDINIPKFENEVLTNNHENIVDVASGLDIVKHIKADLNHNIPVMILSGNKSEDVIEQGFELGASDYMKKPLSLNEIGIRVKQLIGPANHNHKSEKNKFIQDKVIGVVIPCYNEEKRLLSDEFKSFVNYNLSYHLCFVNDGSKDNTLKILQILESENKGRISVFNCEKNGGKAEAVRLGMLHLAAQQQYDYIGFLDADLSTNFLDFDSLVDTIKNSNFKIVSGSRIARMGADIEKESARAIISKTINFLIKKILGMNFKDTQCGAKIMTKEIIEETFQKKFLTKWLFDVEIFMRMRNFYGLDQAKTFIYEKPLNKWIHADGSKLSFKDSLKIAFQIVQIAIHYR